jgi:5'-phosphate synthase pdxT subunit
MTVGILALQGDFEAHGRALAAVGLDSRPVFTEAAILGVEALVLPGGESSAMWKLMEETRIADALFEVISGGLPVFATCAGAILLSRRIANPERKGLGLLDLTTTRNFYGRQLDSIVMRLDDLDAEALGTEPLEAVFIRAPRFSDLGPGVRVLARRDGDPVLVEEGNILAATFHPELSTDPRVLRRFCDLVRTGGRSSQAAA